MVRLHAITESQWRLTVRIAGKRIFGLSKMGRVAAGAWPMRLVVEHPDRP